MYPFIHLAVYSYSYASPVGSSSSLGWLVFLVPLCGLGIALMILEIVAMWRVFQKAGEPGWASLVPFYNSWTMAKVAGKPGWWGLFPLLCFVPVLGGLAALIISIVLCVLIARNFGKSDAFGVIGLWLFGPIGFPILAFGPAVYKPAVAMSDSTLNQPTV